MKLETAEKFRSELVWFRVCSWIVHSDGRQVDPRTQTKLHELKADSQAREIDSNSRLSQENSEGFLVCTVNCRERERERERELQAAKTKVRFTTVMTDDQHTQSGFA